MLELIADVSVVVWALGSANGPDDLVEALHGPRLERLLERLVDTPVRGFVYEGAGSAPDEAVDEGAALVRAAGGRWRIPVAVVGADPEEHGDWARAMADAARDVLTPP